MPALVLPLLRCVDSYERLPCWIIEGTFLMSILQSVARRSVFESSQHMSPARPGRDQAWNLASPSAPAGEVRRRPPRLGSIAPQPKTRTEPVDRISQPRRALGSAEDAEAPHGVRLFSRNCQGTKSLCLRERPLKARSSNCGLVKRTQHVRRTDPGTPESLDSPRALIHAGD
jgi:hypothetical protein